MFWTQIFDLVLGIGIVILQAGIVGLIGLHFFGKDTVLYRWVEKYSVPMAFFLSLGAVLGSLVYSEIIGLEPCLYCWWQRVLIYPQVLLLGGAWLKNEGATIKKYAIALSSIGAVLGIYHYLAQKISVVADATNCSVAGGVSCSGSYLNVLGYITIPMMSLTILVAIILLLSLKKLSR